MQTATVQEVQLRLLALIAQLRLGEDLMITEGDRPIARLVKEPCQKRRNRHPGSAIGKLAIIDDDANLEDFREYTT